MTELFIRLITRPLDLHDPTQFLFYGSAMIAGLATTYAAVRRWGRR